MCGRFNLHDNPYVRLLLEYLGITTGQPIYRPDIPPGEKISIVRETDGARRLDTAIWWLVLDHKTLKPSKYTSFNSRWDRLDDPKSQAYKPFRQARCIIPASSLCEGVGDKKTHHQIELEGRAIAFGGLYKEYTNYETGETVIGTSIITLPSCEKWAAIHPKSIPLMLDPEDKTLIDRWLDPDFQEVDFFKPLLVPQITHPQRITPIDRPSKWNPIGESYLLD